MAPPCSVTFTGSPLPIHNDSSLGLPASFVPVTPLYTHGGLPRMDKSPSPRYALGFLTSRPSFVLLPLLGSPHFLFSLCSNPVSHGVLTKAVTAPPEGLPDLPPFPRPFLTNRASPTAFISFSFTVLCLGLRLLLLLGRGLCLSCPYIVLIT